MYLLNNKIVDPRKLPKERLECPPWFQDRINEVGGFNRYDEPNFKLAWAQTELMWQGGEWNNEDGHFRGYRQVLKGDGLPHWMLMKWMDAGMGIDMPHLQPEPAELFYKDNKCPESGLQLLGEYPYLGSYHIAYNLLAKWWDGTQLIIAAPTLDWEIVEMMIPIIKATFELDHQTKVRFMKEMKEKEEKDEQTMFEDLYSSIRRKPTLGSTSWLEDKQRKMEKLVETSMVEYLHRNKRFVSNRPL